MKPKKIREIIGGKIKEIKKLSSKINTDFDKDTIHEFRVAVKSLRSFLRLLRMAWDDTRPKLSAEFKRLYHIAGAIRDAQLELEQLTAEKLALPVYTDKLDNDIARQKQEWERHYSEKIIRQMKKKLLVCEYETLPPEMLAVFIDNKVKGMENLIKAKPPTNAQIHNIRKQAKDILYTAKLAKKEWKPAYKYARDIDEPQLDKIAAVIGDYNDERITLEHLNSFSSQKMQLEEINAISKVCKKETEKLKAERKQILQMAKEFTHSVKPLTN